MSYFNKDLFSKLLEKAKGDRSLNQYGLKAGVDPGYISRFINLKRVNPPTPDILKKLSDAAYNSVSYEELMSACGYIDNDMTYTTINKDVKSINNNNPTLSEKDEMDVAKQLEKTMELLDQQEDMMFDGEPLDDETKELLRQSLENSMRMAKAINKKYTPKKYRK